MNPKIYSKEVIDTFYLVLRHKVAHFAHPYFVTIGGHGERIAWEVHAGYFQAD